mgnify:CR=1 FL=1
MGGLLHLGIITSFANDRILETAYTEHGSGCYYETILWSMPQLCALDEFLAIVVGQKLAIDRHKDQNGLGDVPKQANNCPFCQHFAY